MDRRFTAAKHNWEELSGQEGSTWSRLFPVWILNLEAPSLWPDVHTSLSFAIRDQLQPQLSPRYTAAITSYVAFEMIEIAPARVAVPDVGILDRDVAPARGGAVAIAPAPLTGIVALEAPTRYQRIEVRTVGDETLVAAIEILSPVNKRPGVEGADAYERKRRELLRSEAHLMEIDLLRGGRRPALVTPLPPKPYFICLSRVQRRPEIEIWPISLQQPLPLVPVPLRPPDADVALDLGAVFHRIYTSARYDLRIDYRQAPPPPDLPPDDATWLDTRLRERGLR